MTAQLLDGWCTGDDAAGDPPNSELPDGDLFGPYPADDTDVPPLGLLLYGRRDV